MSFKPEVLAPAGSLEKLKAAISYGADAVYLAGQKFGLRSAADNFTPEELSEGVEFARQHGSQVYCVLNAFPHDKDIEELPEFLGLLTELKVNAVIVSDIGVMNMVKRHTDIPIHLSTQASCLNIEAVKVWKALGAKRIIFGREVSIKAAGKIKKTLGIEVELFIHGSMCMSYSGHCTISNFTKGRDSNRGGCAQSCRFPYQIDYKNHDGVTTKTQTYFMSSKDLNGLDLVPDFFKYEINSVKIEGRMRSPLYAALSARTYRIAIDEYSVQKKLTAKSLVNLSQELNLIPHRDYFSGNLSRKASSDSILDSGNFKDKAHFRCLGTFQNPRSNLFEVKAQFKLGELLEYVSFSGEILECQVSGLTDLFKQEIGVAKINSLVHLELASLRDRPMGLDSINPGEIIRRREMGSQHIQTEPAK